jgi:hypothetical protein
VPSCRFSVAMCSDGRLAVLLGRLAKAAGEQEAGKSWLAGQGRPPFGGLVAWRPWGCRAAKGTARRPHPTPAHSDHSSAPLHRCTAAVTYPETRRPETPAVTLAQLTDESPQPADPVNLGPPRRIPPLHHHPSCTFPADEGCCKTAPLPARFASRISPVFPPTSPFGHFPPIKSITTLGTTESSSRPGCSLRTATATPSTNQAPRGLKTKLPTRPRGPTLATLQSSSPTKIRCGSG